MVVGFTFILWHTEIITIQKQETPGNTRKRHHQKKKKKKMKKLDKKKPDKKYKCIIYKNCPLYNFYFLPFSVFKFSSFTNLGLFFSYFFKIP